MTFIRHYDSPLGGILLAADEVGLTGLWFDGEKYFADHLPEVHIEEKRQYFPMPYAGSIYTLPVKSLTLCRRCTPLVLGSGWMCGRYF